MVTHSTLLTASGLGLLGSLRLLLLLLCRGLGLRCGWGLGLLLSGLGSFGLLLWLGLLLGGLRFSWLLLAFPSLLLLWRRRLASKFQSDNFLANRDGVFLVHQEFLYRTRLGSIDGNIDLEVYKSSIRPF